ncbi:MAG: RsmB/NOP family class I SAM-dependent RNA methyltransferase [bacterium]
MIHQNRLRFFNDCLLNYTHQYPLSRYLKEFFKANKQMGSKDRKFLSSLMYANFRMGDVFKGMDVNERVIIASYLVNELDIEFIKHFNAELGELPSDDLNTRIENVKKIYSSFNLNEVFPLSAEISSEIDREEFIKSHFIQPDLFLRAINNKHEKLISYLDTFNIAYEKEGRTIRIKNATRLEEPAEYLFEVQDKSSQAVIDYLDPKPNEYWWDCCAASGGKSLLLKELEPDCYLMCSDVRETILKNLDERFAKAGIQKYKRRLIDLTAEINSFEPETFDGIILDAPCTGSGTWSRTPERIAEVDLEKVKYFAELQYKIADNAIQFLKKGKKFIYITCSVFSKENEEMVEKLVKEHSLKVLSQGYVKGFADRADSMFVAVISKCDN